MRARPGATGSAPLGTGRDWRRRLLLHHLPLAVASSLILAVLLRQPAIAARGHALTVASGYLALGLLGLTLLIGPANLLLNRRNPVSNSLRRDVGTWTTIASAIHVIVAFGVDGAGQILRFFIRDGRPLLGSFGLGSWTGLAALLIVALLQAISTDGILRELKARTWKELQRLNYTLFALVSLHSLCYGAPSRPASPTTLLLVGTVTVVVTGQAVGIWLWRRSKALTVAGRPARRPLDRPW